MDQNQLLFPHGELTGVEVMIDYLDDNQRRLKRYLNEVDEDCLHWKIDPEAISIAVILWHMGRLLDVFTFQLALGRSSDQECWFSGGWAEETGYDPRGLGRDGWGSLNQYSPAEVAAIPRFSWSQLSGYLDDVYRSVRDTLNFTPMTLLAQPGAGFDGQYTRYQIISMALMDNVRHLGEIRLIKSLYSRDETD
jgi:hypothetical protein